jgi:outer membrane biosynthesis protein TonB
MPARFQMGDEVNLQAFFTEEGERISDPDFLGVITVNLSMTTEDGRKGTRILSEDQPPADGIYRDTISRLPEPGQYLLELEADGGTFSRKFRKTLVLEAPEGEATAPAGEDMPLAPEPAHEPQEPVPEAEPEPQAPPEGPVDLSQVEEPEAEPATPPEPETETAPASEDQGPSLVERVLAWWPWAVGVVIAVLLGAVALILFRRRQSREDEPDADDDGAPETPQDKPAAPVDTAIPEQTDAEEEAPADIDSPEVETDSIMETDEPPGETEAGGDDTAEPPVAETVTEPEAGEADTSDEAPAEAEDEQPAPEEPAELEAGEPDTESVDDLDSLPDDDDDEFGLEDFDLSDIDDLPDLETDESDEDVEKPAQDKDRKKE